MVMSVWLTRGPFGHGPNKNEMLLKRAQMSHELIWLVSIVENYKDRSSFMIDILHLEGEKVFGLAKHCANCLHGENGDSHRPNNESFFHPWLASPATSSNNVQNVPTHPTPFASHYILPIFSWSGLELKEINSINGPWHIEQCTTNSFILCSTL
jgi:hypothetical protein